MANDSNRKLFQVIEGGKGKQPGLPDLEALFAAHDADPYTKRHKDDVEQLVCRTCDIHEGVKTSLFIDAEQSPFVKGNDLVGGTHRRLCVYCLIKGRVTAI